MMRIILFLIVLGSLNISARTAQAQDTGNIEVNISEFRNTDGHLLISLFNSSEDYPRNKKNAFRVKKVKVNGKTENVVFDDLPYGEYALIFLHDENDNEEMNTNMMGIPQEGYGASNNAVNTFSAPKYEEAKFQLDKPLVIQSLKIHY